MAGAAARVSSETLSSAPSPSKISAPRATSTACAERSAGASMSPAQSRRRPRSPGPARRRRAAEAAKLPRVDEHRRRQPLDQAQRLQPRSSAVAEAGEQLRRHAHRRRQPPVEAVAIEAAAATPRSSRPPPARTPRSRALAAPATPKRAVGGVAPARGAAQKQPRRPSLSLPSARPDRAVSRRSATGSRAPSAAARGSADLADRQPRGGARAGRRLCGRWKWPRSRSMAEGGVALGGSGCASSPASTMTRSRCTPHAAAPRRHAARPPARGGGGKKRSRAPSAPSVPPRPPARSRPSGARRRRRAPRPPNSQSSRARRARWPAAPAGRRRRRARRRRGVDAAGANTPAAAARAARAEPARWSAGRAPRQPSSETPSSARTTSHSSRAARGVGGVLRRRRAGIGADAGAAQPAAHLGRRRALADVDPQFDAGRRFPRRRPFPAAASCTRPPARCAAPTPQRAVRRGRSERHRRRVRRRCWRHARFRWLRRVCAGERKRVPGHCAGRGPPARRGVVHGELELARTSRLPTRLSVPAR